MASESEGVGARIREYREAAGLSQTEVGRRLGVKQQSVGKWERGSALPQGARLAELADVLGVTVAEILGQRDLSSGRLDAIERRLNQLEALVQDLARELRDSGPAR